MSVSLKEIFNEHKWLWLAAALLIFTAGALSAIWLNARNAEHIDVPVMDASRTDDASRKIGETITEAQQRKYRLPEVGTSAPNDDTLAVAAAATARLADRCHGILGRYRQRNTSAVG